MRYLLLVLAAAGLACRTNGAGAAAADGSLTAAWTAAGREVRFAAPAEARWCVRDTSLEILAVRNDTAVGLALYARDSLRAETYPAVLAAAFAPLRPQAAAALRFVLPNELKGFESSRGQVVVTAGGSHRVSGTFDVRLRHSVGTDSLHLTGRFDRLTVVPDAAVCGRALKPVTG